MDDEKKEKCVEAMGEGSSDRTNTVAIQTDDTKTDAVQTDDDKKDSTTVKFSFPPGFVTGDKIKLAKVSEVFSAQFAW